MIDGATDRLRATLRILGAAALLFATGCTATTAKLNVVAQHYGGRVFECGGQRVLLL